MDIGFGVSRARGPYMVTESARDVSLSYDFHVPETFQAVGQIGLFQLLLQGNADGNTGLTGSLDLNIGASAGAAGTRSISPDFASILSNSAINFGQLAHIDLDAAFGFLFQRDGTGRLTEVSDFPSITANLVVDWNLGSPAAPSVAFNDITLNFGELLNQFLNPIISPILQAMEPLKPILDLLSAPLPLVSAFSDSPVTILDVAQLQPFNQNVARAAAFIESVADIYRLAALLGSADENVTLDLGDFRFGNFDLRKERGSGSGALPKTFSGLNDPTFQTLVAGSDLNTADEIRSQPGAGQFNQVVPRTGDHGLSIPILDDPKSILGLMFGFNVDLVRYKPPSFEIDVEFEFPPIPVWSPPPVLLTIGVEAGVEVRLAFGYDTGGLVAFSKTHDINSLLDGLYLDDDPDRLGDDPLELRAFFGVTAKASVSVGVLEVEVEGGLFGFAGLNLKDDVDPITGEGDGKVRGREIFDKLNQGSPLCLFDAEGGIEFSLDLEISFLFLDFEITLIPPTTLVDFEVDLCDPIILATLETDGTLNLNVGDRTWIRDTEGSDTEDETQEIYKITDFSNGVVQIEGFGQKHIYGLDDVKVQRIVGDFGGDNDALVVEGNLTQVDGITPITFDIKGGTGDDVLRGAQGDDIIDGGAGNDRIEGMDGNDILYSDQFGPIDGPSNVVDYIDGGSGNDLIFGAAGRDVVRGQGGRDIIHGRGGRDNLFGGAGNDDIFGGSEDDYLIGGGDDDFIDGEAGNDLIVGEGGADRLYGNRFGSSDFNENDYIFGGYANALLKELIAPEAYDRLFDVDGLRSGELAALFGNYPGLLNAIAGYELDTSPDLADEIEGNGGNDVIAGGEGADVIRAGTGDDAVLGGAGADQIIAGDGADTVFGDADDDLIYGNAGDDWLSGGSGRDRLEGDVGNDTIFGDADADLIYGHEGNDTIFGGAANDRIFGNSGDDTIYGQEDDDFIEGNDGADTIRGNQGADFIRGNAGRDLLLGGSGNDYVEGNEGDDVVLGGSGADILHGNAGIDYIEGGSGDDVVHGGSEADVILGGTGSDRLFADTGIGDELYGQAGDDELHGSSDGQTVDPQFFDLVRFGDLLNGGSGNDVIRGYEGADLIFGGDADDTIYAGSGNDLVFGGLGFDVIYGDVGADVLWGDDGTGSPSGGSDLIFGGLGADTLYGEGGQDTLHGDWDADTLDGGIGDDVLYGDYGVGDVLRGAAGDDLLYAAVDGGSRLEGDVGEDRLIGSAGPDTLLGEEGADILDGGGGDDLLEGGAGADLLLGGAGHDTIYAFAALGTADASADILFGDDGTGPGGPGAGRDRLFGGPGSDHIFGEGGDDFVDPGTGSDVFDPAEALGNSLYTPPPASPLPPLVAPNRYSASSGPILPDDVSRAGRWIELAGPAGIRLTDFEGGAFEPSVAAGVDGTYVAWATLAAARSTSSSPSSSATPGYSSVAVPSVAASAIPPTRRGGRALSWTRPAHRWWPGPNRLGPPRTSTLPASTPMRTVAPVPGLRSAVRLRPAASAATAAPTTSS